MLDLLDLQQLVPREMPPEYRKQQEVVASYLHRMGRGFSPDFLDDFWTEVGRLMAFGERPRLPLRPAAGGGPQSCS